MPKKGLRKLQRRGGTGTVPWVGRSVWVREGKIALSRGSDLREGTGIECPTGNGNMQEVRPFGTTGFITEKLAAHPAPP